MKKFASLCVAALFIASAASASDVVQNGKDKDNHAQHLLKTSKSAQCSTSSGKMSRRECQEQSAQPTRARAY